jgi:hypothetical protein
MLDVISELAKGFGISKPTTRSFDGLQFPANLNANYYMNLRFYEYQRQDINSIGSAKPLTILKLPIPTNLSDSQGVEYGDEKLGTSLGGAANAIMGVGNVAPKVGNFINAVGVAGLVGAVTGVSPSLTNLASAKFGITANPFLTVMFKAPRYKEYDFAWRFYPRNAAESASLQSIVEAIKYHMLPDAFTGAGGAILSYPSLVKAKIIAGGTELYPFKYGVVKNYSFNYAPDGVPSFHKQGKPTAVDVKVTIQEVEYFLKSSPGSSVDSEGG